MSKIGFEALRRAYVSYNRLEWWCGHLATALARHVEVVACPMERYSQPGHPVLSDINQLIDLEERRAFYLGSVDQLFLNIADLPIPTCTWVDFFFPNSLNFLPCLRLFDVVFCSQKDSIPGLEQAGLGRVEWLPFALDTTLRNEPETEKVYDIGFVGSLQLPATRDERVDVLGRLERKYRMNDYRVPVFGDDMMRVYNQSRIVINIPACEGLNMRTFETLASGALLLTKPVGNGQDELFKDGTHLVTYHSEQDLADKIDYYLRHDREREEIASAGRREVLAKHTYDHRAARVLDVMVASPARTRAHDRAARIAAYAAFYDYLGRADLLAAVALDRGVPLATRVRLLWRAALKCGRFALNFRKHGGVMPTTR